MVLVWRRHDVTETPLAILGRPKSDGDDRAAALPLAVGGQ